MKKSITIRIAKPCHEDWNKMTQTEKGKFCKVCTKEVFDFTKINDEELVKKVDNNENLCGRFKSSQLNRKMILEQKSGLSLAPLAASFLLSFTLLVSNKVKSTPKKNYTSLNIGSLYHNGLEKSQIITTGKIIDKNGKPLSNVEIMVKESGKSEVSGLRGDFKIFSACDGTLIIKKKGFITQELELDRKSRNYTITLETEIIEVFPATIGKIAIDQNSERKRDTLSEKKKDSLKVIVKGTITDEERIPLPGVNIIIKGTSLGTQTDFDGNYSIETGKNQILVFSYIGFKTEEITTPTNNNKIDVQMVMTEELMGEVVIITGGISIDYSYEIMGYKKSTYDPEPAPWKKKAQTSFDNEKEYSKIKRARKKQKKILKRKKK